MPPSLNSYCAGVSSIWLSKNGSRIRRKLANAKQRFLKDEPKRCVCITAIFSCILMKSLSTLLFFGNVRPPNAAAIFRSEKRSEYAPQFPELKAGVWVHPPCFHIQRCRCQPCISFFIFLTVQGLQLNGKLSEIFRGFLPCLRVVSGSCWQYRMIYDVHSLELQTLLRLALRLEELHVPTSSIFLPGLSDEEKQKYEDMAKESNDEYLKKMEDSTVSNVCFFTLLGFNGFYMLCTLVSLLLRVISSASAVEEFKESANFKKYLAAVKPKKPAGTPCKGVCACGFASGLQSGESSENRMAPSLRIWARKSKSREEGYKED